MYGKIKSNSSFPFYSKECQPAEKKRVQFTTTQKTCWLSLIFELKFYYFDHKESEEQQSDVPPQIIIIVTQWNIRSYTWTAYMRDFILYLKLLLIFTQKTLFFVG